MTLTVVDGANPLPEFLSLLYGDNTGYIYVATKDSGSFSQQFYEWPNDSVACQQFIQANAGYSEVYVAPALFASADSGLKDNVKGSQVVWAEFDGNAPDVSKLPDTIPAPSIRIISSEAGHEHWYWRLAQFTTDTDSLERINRALAYHLGADASGWDANQILRPPGTLNHKRNKPVNFIEVSDEVYSVDAFASWEAPERINDQLIQEVIPDAFDVAMAYAWPTQASNLYRQRDIPPGQRSSALMQLGYFCGEMGMSNAEIYSVIRNADDRWGKFKDRSDRDRRLLDLISKVRIKYPLGGTRLEGVAPIELEVYGLKALLAKEVQVEWVIEGLLQKQGSMLLTGPSGVGKTQLSLRFAMSLALGHPYLGFSVDAPHRIMFLSLEMGLADIKYFLSQMAENLNDDEMEVLQENLLIVPVGTSIYLDKEAEQKRLESLINEHRPDGIMYDSLGSTTADELSSETVVKAITDWDAIVRQKFDVFSWFIHHQRKAQAQNKKPKTLADVYGSQYITARATSVYCFWREMEQLELICLKKRLARMDDPVRIERHGHLDFMRAVGTELKHLPGEKVEAEFNDPEPPEGVGLEM